MTDAQTAVATACVVTTMLVVVVWRALEGPNMTDPSFYVCEGW